MLYCIFKPNVGDSWKKCRYKDPEESIRNNYAYNLAV